MTRHRRPLLPRPPEWLIAATQWLLLWGFATGLIAAYYLAEDVAALL